MQQPQRLASPLGAMGWEWRCFVPLPTRIDISDGSDNGVEQRTDEYLLVPSDEVGVKLRGTLLQLVQHFV